MCITEKFILICIHDKKHNCNSLLKTTKERYNICIRKFNVRENANDQAHF